MNKINDITAEQQTTVKSTKHTISFILIVGLAENDVLLEA